MKASKWLSSYVRKDSVTEPLLLTFSSVEVEEVGPPNEKEEKLVAYFEELEQGVVLGSKTVLRFLVGNFGDETADWIGKKVVLYVDNNILYAGKRIGGLRFRLPEKGAK